MAEPHSSIVAGALTGAGISSVTIIMGAHADALVIGLISAVFVSIWLESIDSHVKAAAAVLFSAMLAAYGSPVAAAMLISSVPSSAGSAEPLRLLLALLIGGGGPSLVPLAIRYLGNRLNGAGGKV